MLANLGDVMVTTNFSRRTYRVHPLVDRAGCNQLPALRDTHGPAMHRMTQSPFLNVAAIFFVTIRTAGVPPVIINGLCFDNYLIYLGR
jgi:hypothetical protein